MATDAENLRTARSNFIAELAAISAERRPSYTIGDRTVSWTEYVAELKRSISEINVMIADEDGVYEVQVEGVV